MTKKRIKSILGLILLFGLLAGIIAYPSPVNKGISFLNEKTGLDLPSFWNISFKLGLDLQGGTHLVYEADTSGISSEEKSSIMQGLRDIIERRVNLFGVQEPVVQVQESGEHTRLIVELAGIKDPSEAIRMIGETPFLEFREEREEEDREKILDAMERFEQKEDKDLLQFEDWALLFEDPYFQPTLLTGKYLKKADLDFDQVTYRPIVGLQFNDEGKDLFKEITSNNIGKQVAIYIDNVLLSAPVVQETISEGRAQITGDFTIEWARELVRGLNAGALPVPITLISQQSVGPTLGAISLNQSLYAAVYGFLAIIVFMIIFYRFSGLLASFALLIYIAVFLSIVKIIPITLTLAGIGGLILSIGMAVDANILIFSRTKEELKGGENLDNALEQGFKRSWPSVRDGNITTFIVAMILFFFGTSFIKGFALTLSVGILLSMVSAFFVTKNLMLFFSFTSLKKWKRIWL
ncbi:MAG: protein translocase subunit SecD [Candidatus Pacebacteria bacterium]|nr:protein translocase subunit SecD [Candidatus Paceibacterota bacterium]